MQMTHLMSRQLPYTAEDSLSEPKRIHTTIYTAQSSLAELMRIHMHGYMYKAQSSLAELMRIHTDTVGICSLFRGPSLLAELIGFLRLKY